MGTLSVQNLVKFFGGVRATDQLTLEFRDRELHAVIGPNGAGKTTLVGQLAGELKPSSGRILLEGRDITMLPIFARSLMGIGRSFQITSLWKSFSALDNVAFSIQARTGHSFRFWAQVEHDRALREEAFDVLASVGLAARADVTAGALAHGEQRQLELAIALAGKPRLLLLDEPMAGMGREDSARMVKLLASLKGRYTIVLVEHDMDAVFALADRISVLVMGRCIACDTPERIRRDAAVRAAYLGEEGAT